MSKYKFKVGEEVLVKEKLKTKTSLRIDSDMLNFCGKEVRIKDQVDVPADGVPRYKIEGCVWTFTEEMFKKLESEGKEEMKKFNVGDYVIGNSKEYNFTDKDMKLGVITRIDSDGDYRVLILKHENEDEVGNNYGCIRHGDDDFKKVSSYKEAMFDIMEIEDKFGVIIEFKNGEKYVLADGSIYGEDSSYDWDCSSLCEDDFDDNLRCEDNHDYDIKKITYNNVVLFDRTINKGKAKEMTVAEISEALGYEVKVVKD